MENQANRPMCIRTSKLMNLNMGKRTFQCNQKVAFSNYYPMEVQKNQTERPNLVGRVLASYLEIMVSNPAAAHLD